MRRCISRVLLAAFLVAAAAAPTPAVAHDTGTSHNCDEHGYWAPGLLSISGGTSNIAYQAEADVSVTHIPPAADCDFNGSPNFASQHSSLHMRYGAACFETVYQREDNGQVFMWGYNCGPGNPGTQEGNQWIGIGNYSGSSTLRLWAGRDGDFRFSGWFYRPDTGSWTYIGSTSGLGRNSLTPHVESTGYNHSSVRKSHFTNYTSDGYGVSFACQSSAYSFDHRQKMANNSPMSQAFFGVGNEPGRTFC